jgi:dephospho-CoA kinase
MARVFGLTGGIASGKSTVSRRFAARGVPIVDADVVARDVVRPGSEGLAALVAAFGPTILDATGALDRPALAALAFASRDAQRTLNGITHPRIAIETQRRLAAVDGPLACYDAALLVENGLADAFRPLVVVAADEATQITRAIARDGLAEDEIRRRIGLQKPLADKIALADVVIHNDGTLDELLERTDDALDQILRRCDLDLTAFPRPRRT